MSLEMPDTPSSPDCVVEQLLDRARVHPALVHQVEHDAGVERPAARAHRQPVERGEAHRARDAPAGLQRAHARAVAEVAARRSCRPPPARRAAAAPRRCIRTTARGSRSAARRRRAARPGCAKRCATSGFVAWNAVSKHATCGSSGGRSSSERIGARLCGWCSGASGTSFSSSREHVGVDPHRLGVVAARRAPRGARPPRAAIRSALRADEVGECVDGAVVAELDALAPGLLRRTLPRAVRATKRGDV